MHKKDHHSRRGLLMLVGRRRRLLDYVTQQRRRALPDDHRNPRPAPLAHRRAAERGRPLALSNRSGGSARSVVSRRSLGRCSASQERRPAGGRRLGTGSAAPRRSVRRSGRRRPWLTPSPFPVPSSGTDKTLTFATGVLAPQSQGAVVAGIGDTQALVTANGDKSTREGIDFFPLTVDVEEQAYAAGQDPRLVLPPGGPARRQRDPHLPPDRPAAAPVVRRRLPQRDPGRRSPSSAPTRRTPTTSSPSTAPRPR